MISSVLHCPHFSQSIVRHINIHVQTHHFPVSTPRPYPNPSPFKSSLLINFTVNADRHTCYAGNHSQYDPYAGFDTAIADDIPGHMARCLDYPTMAISKENRRPFDLFLGTRVLRELFGVFLWSKSAIPHRFRMEVVWLATLHGSITKAVMCIGDLLRGRKGDPVGTIEAVTNEYD